jgi:uncharacterized membrane protein YphA (DoxX/SURF4 family)
MSTNNATQADTSIFGRFLVRFTDEFYLVFRLIFAFIVALHGAQKAFLMWGFPANHPLGARVDIAGWVELISALLIASGIFTRLGAGALCVTMVVAYFTVHSGGVAPHIFPNPAGDMGSAFGAHGGEIPILWFAIAGIIGVLGSRKYGLERLILKKEIL